MTIVFRVSDELKKKMIAYYADKKKRKTPPYAIFQAMDADTIITLYESGKAMFQGISADIDAKMWAEIERQLTGKRINISEGKQKLEKAKKIREAMYKLNVYGSDEVGVGDFFGPIVVTAAYVSKDTAEFVDKLGVRDSKLITDEKIVSFTPTLMKKIPYVSYTLSCKEYNEYQKRGYNMNRIKAVLHNKVLYELMQKGYPHDKIVVDQFVYPAKYFEHLKDEKNIVKGISFMTKAENVCSAVAAASCISRYIFLQEIDKLSAKLDIPILKGAGEDVDKLAAVIVKKYGEEILNDIAKCNFKNIEKYKAYLK